jgi:hypothetical protein
MVGARCGGSCRYDEVVGGAVVCRVWRGGGGRCGR